MTTRRPDERGQAALLVVVLMTVLVGIMALALDAGLWYVDKRELQASADAAVLAGAPALVSGTSAATAAANSTYAANGDADDLVSYSFPRAGVMRVTATRDLEMHFAGVLGIAGGVTTVHATASLRAYTRLERGVIPWSIMQNDFRTNVPYTFYADGLSTMNGPVSLPVVTSSGGCTGTGGGSDYRDSVASSAESCPLAVGSVIPTKPGTMVGPTKQGLDARIAVYEPITSIVRFNANGTADILNPDSPQLVEVPIVVNAAGGTTWPRGGNVRVVGFAYFVITGYREGGRQVDGYLVRAVQHTPDPTTDWTPDAGIFTMELSE